MIRPPRVLRSNKPPAKAMSTGRPSPPPLLSLSIARIWTENSCVHDSRSPTSFFASEYRFCSPTLSSAKMVPEHLGKRFRSPANQIRNLAITDFNDAELAIRTLHNINGIEAAGKAFGAFTHDKWHVTNCRVRRTIEDGISLRLEQKALHTPDTESAFNDTSVFLHVGNHSGNVRRVEAVMRETQGSAFAAEGLEADICTHPEALQSWEGLSQFPPLMVGCALPAARLGG